MKQFFSLFDCGHDYEVETFATEEEAQADMQATVDAARAGLGGLEKFHAMVWGKILGTVGEDGQLTPVPPIPDPGAERPRAELAAFRARVGVVLAGLLILEAHQRQLKDGWDGFVRAVAYERATNLLKDALDTMDAMVSEGAGEGSETNSPGGECPSQVRGRNR